MSCVRVVIRYNNGLRRSGGTADAAVSKTVVERRAGSNPASGTSYLLLLLSSIFYDVAYATFFIACVFVKFETVDALQISMLAMNGRSSF